MLHRLGLAHAVDPILCTCESDMPHYHTCTHFFNISQYMHSLSLKTDALSSPVLMPFWTVCTTLLTQPAMLQQHFCLQHLVFT